MGFLKKVFSSFSNTRKNIRSTFKNILNIDSLSEDDYMAIEECLLSADISWDITERIIEKIKSSPINGSIWEEVLFNLFKDVLEIPAHVKLKKIILKWKKNLKKKKIKGKFINHPPHSTIFLANIRNKKKLFSVLEKNIANFNLFEAVHYKGEPTHIAKCSYCIVN